MAPAKSEAKGKGGKGGTKEPPAQTKAPVPESGGDESNPAQFQHVLSGYPPAYFNGILPQINMGPAYRLQQQVAFDYKKDADCTADSPIPDSPFKPTSPTPMYVSCMPWAAYPYGVPVAGAASNRAITGNLIAVPTPRPKTASTIVGTEPSP